ncbi:MAG: S1 family peptidase [Firmicutes bacterium]|nr:S1 family peptidase [Bacillota bacterium]
MNTNLTKSKFIAILLSFTMIFNLAMMSTVSAEYDNVIFPEDYFQNEDFLADVQNYLVEAFGVEFMQNQNESLKIHDEIMATFPQNRAGETVHPDFFGGVYINDAGILVTLLVETDTFTDSFNARTFSELGSLFRFVEFSYNELVADMEYIQRIAAADVQRVFSIANVFSLDIIQNRVVIYLHEYTPEQIELFRSTVLDSPTLHFVESTFTVEPIPDFIPEDFIFYDEEDYELIPQESEFYNEDENIISPLNVQLNSGNSISTSSGTRSLGFRARRGSVNGFVTAAHSGGSFFTSNTRVYAGNTTTQLVGLIQSATDISHIRDAAFVTLSGASVTNWLPSGSLGTFVATPVVGNAVVSLSRSGINVGRINSLGSNINIHGVTILAVPVTFSRTVQQGDSGGLVYTESAGSTHPVSGMIVARNEANPNIGWYVRADLILNTLGLTLH